MITVPENFKCLGIESSCDETSASVVIGGRTVLSNVIASQIDIHKEFGGVVPEIASRKHVETILPVIDDAMKEAGYSGPDLDIIAVTCGPGLIGALLVGTCAAKGLASVWKKPVIGVNHIEGHILANLIGNPELQPPFISLVVSGGHSHIILVNEDFAYETIARTRDDAAGEAFDKIARKIGLGYPGGPLIDKCAADGDPDAFTFPRTRFPDGSLDFSFSGLKTAALNHINQHDISGCISDFAASFQKAVVSVLVNHTMEAASLRGMNTICVAGGVASNSLLRKMMRDETDKSGLRLYIPESVFCTDNAAMIACAGTYSYLKGNRDGMDLNAFATLSPGAKH
ncbi:MAG: tRNA (adenosine(37)-N6)-threonylcarbamoyltransferase complex transferase subunit TsaD [Eubacteriales bacterium]|nr:tRNA (adenosine(37)-N6)-threonylcarbamoyltransferase complex transferase subunit TsaD [Eubacteriales bacterium]MDD4328057.1 tRNA (adenosine(37)-N6)-threonylcarbamoyltransferase complex transferase subunit TsaD [Eubacteriales bacterium]MDD4716695.1 tRNA (adenosine(37)-N6)-threonylcarbamoyltransferase complex transferase subunit TsaD [Eubacteriales bacterium]